MVLSMESRPVLAIDGEETAILCWGDTRHPQAYTTNDRTCRLRIRPGRHTVTFSPATNSLSRATTSFTAEAGKTYGLEWSQCRGTVDERNLHQSTCTVNVVERGGSGGS